MKTDKLTLKKQSGKVTGVSGTKNSDTPYYQVGKHGDYVQERN